MSNSSHSLHEQFRAARDLLLRYRNDQLAARRMFRWPRLATFNWAIDWFDVIARDNDRIALRVATVHGENEVTFNRLSRRSDQVAEWLRAKSIVRGDVVMVVLDNRVELWELILALMKIRAVIAPTFTTISRDEFRSRIGRTQARHVIADSMIAPQLDVEDGLAARIAVGSKCAGWLDYADSHHHNASFTPEEPTRADEPLFYYFTSGTTARPKLVVHTHVSYSVGHLSSMYWNGLHLGDIHCNVSAPGWAKHPWSSLFAPWNAEATVVSMDTTYATPDRILKILRTHSVTSFCAPPSVWRALARASLAARCTSLP
jgi:acetyl-CoA synthetase